ncbi:MAG: hypothetical protein B7Y45_08580 [Sphingomonas sp. 28-66-16]|nr:MAG: hypothetical protein B7Y45_08580 [Sphingomonas sp. 28-66-16]
MPTAACAATPAGSVPAIASNPAIAVDRAKMLIFLPFIVISPRCGAVACGAFHSGKTQSRRKSEPRRDYFCGPVDRLAGPILEAIA